MNPADPASAFAALESVEGRVLIVDDEPAVRTYLKKILTDNGCTTLEAPDGTVALQLVRDERPDLVLLDLLLPDLNGYDVCRALKRDPLLRDIPIIIVTSCTDIEDIEQGFRLGATDFIRKPFDARELLVRVRNALLLKRNTEEVRGWRQRMMSELEVAGSLQRKLFAARPLLTGRYTVRSTFQPCMNIGGDFFDVLLLDDERLVAYVGDVSGHGVGPAMMASMLKAMLADLIHETGAYDPVALCTELHTRFRQQVDNPEIYATLFLALFEPRRQQWRCLNCGHPAPLYFASHDAAPVALDAPRGLPIGLIEETGAHYAAQHALTVPAPPGSHLFLYTDGLTEARRSATGEDLGADRLARLVGDLLRDPLLPSVPAAVLARVQAEGYRLEADDCTALLVSQVVPAETMLEQTIPPDHHRVAQLAAECEQLLLARDWPAEAATAVRLLILEHGANVVKHGQLPLAATLSLQLRVRGRAAALLFRDPGRPWDYADGWENAGQCGAEAPCGRGLRIIRSIASHIEHFRRGRENLSYFLVSADFCVARLPDSAP